MGILRNEADHADVRFYYGREELNNGFESRRLSREERASIKVIIISNEVQTVVSFACKGLINATEIIFEEPSIVSQIGWGTFENCQNVSTLMLPDTIRILLPEACKNMAKLSKVRMPEGPQFLADEVFAGCEELFDFKIPRSVTQLGTECLSGCLKLQNQDLTNITRFESMCLDRCEAMTEISFREEFSFGSRICHNMINLETARFLGKNLPPSQIGVLPGATMAMRNSYMFEGCPKVVIKFGKEETKQKKTPMLQCRPKLSAFDLKLLEVGSSVVQPWQQHPKHVALERLGLGEKNKLTLAYSVLKNKSDIIIPNMVLKDRADIRREAHEDWQNSNADPWTSATAPERPLEKGDKVEIMVGCRADVGKFGYVVNYKPAKNHITFIENLESEPMKIHVNHVRRVYEPDMVCAFIRANKHIDESMEYGIGIMSQHLDSF